jgi:cathepsin L
MNNLTTLTPAEYKILLGATRRTVRDDLKKGYEHTRKSDKKDRKVGQPDSFDWLANGVVQGVKDQGNYGSCWAFGAIGAQESMYAIYSKGTPVNLSEQNLVDCDTEDYGCDGGNALSAWDYVLWFQDGNFVTEISYPYTANEGICQYRRATKSTYLNDYGWLFQPIKDNLLEVVYEYGPVAYAIDASHSSFQLYQCGVYDELTCSSIDLDDEVLTIGWDNDSGKDYWIVKNSWDLSWDEKGYIRMSRNTNNQCGITIDSGVPTID